MSRSRKPPKKSPSERLRNSLYGLYIREKPMVDFEVYYEERIEKFINQIEKRVQTITAFSLKRGL